MFIYLHTRAIRRLGNRRDPWAIRQRVVLIRAWGETQTISMYIQQNVKNQINLYTKFKPSKAPGTHIHTRTHKQNVASSSGLPVVSMQKSLDVGAGRASTYYTRKKGWRGHCVCGRNSGICMRLNIDAFRKFRLMWCVDFGFLPGQECNRDWALSYFNKNDFSYPILHNVFSSLFPSTPSGLTH